VTLKVRLWIYGYFSRFTDYGWGTHIRDVCCNAIPRRGGVELSTGTIERLYIEGTNGYGVLVDCGEDAVLLVLASQSAGATDARNQANCDRNKECFDEPCAKVPILLQDLRNIH